MLKPLLLISLSLPFLAFGAGNTSKPAAANPAAPSVDSSVRAVKFNGKALDAHGLATLAQLEAAYRTKLPDGAYWYDPACGAFGKWGGPTLVFLQAGLSLGGPVPADASGSGSGVFINGREIHSFDLQYLQNLVGPIQPGRYFTDAYGNAGLEGGPVLVNLLMAAQQKSGFSHYKSNPYSGESSSISSEGVSFTNSTGKTVSWYPGLGSSTSN
jgi:hypothetical protein